MDKNPSGIPRGRMASSGCGVAMMFLLVMVFLSVVLADDADTATTMMTTTMMIVPEDEVDVDDEEVTEETTTEEIRDEAVEMNTKKDPNAPKNSTHAESGFMPSVHLGPIPSDQQRQTTKLSPFNVGPLLFPDEHKSPFNGLSAIKFGEGKQPPSSPKPARPPAKLENIQQKSPFRPSEKDVNLVKFIDDPKQDCAPAQKISTNHRQSEPIYHQHVTYSAEGSVHPGYLEESYDSGTHQQYANYETKPTKYDTTSLLYHPTIVQSQPESYHHHHHNEAPPTILKPEMIINVQHPVSFQTGSYEKPKTVIYVSHEPHQFYHQPPIYNQLETAEHEETYPIYYDQPQYKSLSPWKKILHIIGAFIPLGLLFALLPNVLKPSSTNADNNPSIVLSKLRVNDLPEHKRGDRLQLELDTDCREERSICRLLAAADTTGFDFLRNLVLRIAEKTAESSVRKKELDRIFEAAKLGNCDILTCDFYDGT